MTYDEVMAYLRERTVEEGECLIWQRAYDKDKTPVGWLGGQCRIVRRWVWEQTRGMSASGYRVFSVCRDNRCVSPDHATRLTPAQAHAETMKRGSFSTATYRAAKVNAVRRRSKLDIDKVREIRRLYAEGTTQKELGERYGCTAKNIGEIVRNKIWVDASASPFAELWRLAA